MLPDIKLATRGADELARSLEEFGPRVAQRVLRPGLRSGVVVLARAQRAAVPRTALSGGQADIRKAIGYRVLRAPRGDTHLSAKAGGGVGTRAPTIPKRGKGKRGGVGISARNIHWYTLGTGPRWTGSKSSVVTKGGKKVGRRSKSTGNKKAFRGKMPAQSFIRQASESAAGPAQFAMRDRIAKGIGREWAKRRKKMGSRY